MNRKLFGILSLVVVLVVSSFGAVFADDGGVTPVEPEFAVPSADTDTSEMVNETPSLWFVELSSAPTADGTGLSTVKAEKNAFRSNAKKAGLTYTERYAFDTLFNGISISIKSSELAKLSRIPGVKAIYPVGTSRIPETQTIDPELATAIAMTGADVAQSELGFTGDGVKVAVMDTGIDYNHTDLGGCFGPTCRVFTGWDFVGDAYNADPTSPSYNPNPVPDNDPDDCNGHGTHVSGIVGANGSVVGVAPGVTFGAYRVFGCQGSVNDDIMLAAMERILADDMDVLNMSIGDAFGWPQYPTAQASDRLVNKGIVVVASIGNSGTSGLYAAGAPGLGKKVIGVASFDNSHIRALSFNVNSPGDGRAVAYLTLATTDNPPTSGNSDEIVHVGRGCLIPVLTATPPVPAGGDPYLANPSGKVALIERGVCTFNEKYQRAVAAGATGVIVYNSSTGLFAGGGVVGVPGKFGISISRADGLYLRTLVGSSAAWTNVFVNAPNPTGGLISSFSSYGLSPDLALKPDIGAPGGLIRSTYPVELGSYATISGTSMSSPHVAGAVALYLEAHPNTSSQVMRDILQNSADPKNWSGNPGLGFLDLVHRQGAGMLDIDDTILATTKVTPGKISAGESSAGPFAQTLTLENSGNAAVTYDLSFVNALSTGNRTNPNASGQLLFSTSDASVVFSASSVTVPAGGTASVNAAISGPSGPDRGQYGGYIVFTPQGGGQVYRVPFSGFVGDYQTMPVFNGLGPFLTNNALSIQPANTVFTMTSASTIPYFAIHLHHQVRLLRVEIFNQNGKAWHRAYNEEYLPRNTSNGGVFLFPFDGTTFAGNKTYSVPDGTYYAVVSVLKANGDAANPAHWETWTSPNFVVDRP